MKTELYDKEEAAAIQEITEQFQKQCHALVNIVMSHRTDSPPKLAKSYSYQDATNVWLFLKLAEFEFRLREVEKNK